MKKSKMLSRWVTRTILPPLGAVLIRLLGRFMRISVQGAAQVDKFHHQTQGVIIAFWHGRQLMMPLAYRGKNIHILISQHYDGELIHQIIRRFGFSSVRGSTTRGGTAALRQLIRIARTGSDLVVTPDGPKGPRQVVQEGVIYLAKMTGLPIVPLTFACSKKKSFPVGINSWFLTHSPKDCLYGGHPL